MIKKFLKVNLISDQDIAYKKYCSIKASEFYINRHTAIADPSNIIGEKAEEIALIYLNNDINLSEKRILSYSYRDARGIILQRYKEIDAVSISKENSITLFEVKSSASKSSLKKANSQLNESESILKTINKDIKKIIILVLNKCDDFDSRTSGIYNMCKELNIPIQPINNPNEIFENGKIGLMQIDFD